MYQQPQPQFNPLPGYNQFPNGAGYPATASQNPSMQQMAQYTQMYPMQMQPQPMAGAPMPAGQPGMMQAPMPYQM